MNQLGLIEEALTTCAQADGDILFLTRHAVRGDLEVHLQEALFERLCLRWQLDPNTGVVSQGHAFSHGEDRHVIDIVRWKDERRIQPQTILQIVHNRTFESTSYPVNNTRRRMVDAAGFAQGAAGTDIFCITLLTHFHHVEPFHRFKARGSSYNAMMDARNRRRERIEEVEKGFLGQHRHFELSSGGTLLRNAGCEGFDVEVIYYIFDGTFEAAHNRELFNRPRKGFQGRGG